MRTTKRPPTWTVGDDLTMTHVDANGWLTKVDADGWLISHWGYEVDPVVTLAQMAAFSEARPASGFDLTNAGDRKDIAGAIVAWRRREARRDWAAQLPAPEWLTSEDAEIIVAAAAKGRGSLTASEWFNVLGEQYGSHPDSTTTHDAIRVLGLSRTTEIVEADLNA